MEGIYIEPSEFAATPGAEIFEKFLIINLPLGDLHSLHTFRQKKGTL